MSLDTELEKLKLEVCMAFNGQFGTSLKASEVKALFRKPFTGTVMIILFVTDTPVDNLRFRLAIKRFGGRTHFNAFMLKVKRNSSGGNLNDEVQESICEISKANYPYLKSYAESRDYLEYIAGTSQLKTKTGKKIQTKSGFKLLTQH